MRKLFTLSIIALILFCLVITDDTVQTNNTKSTNTTEEAKTTNTTGEEKTTNTTEEDKTTNTTEEEKTTNTTEEEKTTNTTEEEKTTNTTEEEKTTNTTEEEKTTNTTEEEKTTNTTDDNTTPETDADKEEEENKEEVPDQEEEGDKTITFGEVSFNVKAKSGKMTVNRQNGNNTDSVNIEFNSISEVDEQGNLVGVDTTVKHTFNSFATQDFVISEAKNDTFQDLKVVTVEMSTSGLVDEDTRLKVFIYVFEANGTIDLGNNQTQAVKPGSVKFSVDVENWPFCTANGTDLNKCESKNQTEQIGKYLDFAMKVTGDKEVSKATTGYNFGSGDLFLANNVKVDDKWEALPENYPMVSEEGLFTFRFSRFESKVLYDPTVEFHAVTGSRFIAVCWTLSILVLGFMF